jgi:hypothetical protein
MLLVTGTALAGDTKDKTLPGSKLLHKFDTEVYRLPVLLNGAGGPHSEAGPRLLVWVDAFDPMPIPRIPSEPLPDPVFDLVIWDVTANKQLSKIAYPKEGAPYSPANAGMLQGPFGTIAFTPDGKRLACKSTTYKQVPGKAMHEASTTIKWCDVETRKWEQAIPTVFGGSYGPYMVFAPDGALVIIHDKKCTVHEPGKEKPRLTFDVVRAASAATNQLSNAVRDMVISPDGTLLAFAADGLVAVYDLTNGKKVYEASRAAPEAKTTFGQSPERASLAFLQSQNETKLLAVEVVIGPPKSFVLSRVFDLKEKKEIAHKSLAEETTKGNPGGLNVKLPTWGQASACFNSKAEPRIVFDGKLFDGTSGKVLDRFDGGVAALATRDGKFLVLAKQSKSDSKKWSVELWSLDGDR